MTNPLIITVAPNGARKTPGDHPALPITADELAQDAQACLAAGAAMIHLHVRDDLGAHTLDVATYRAAIQAVRAAVGDDLVIQVTTEAVGRYTPAEQIAMVRQLRPEAVSVALAELTAGGVDQAVEFYRWAEAEGTALQHILYSPGDVARLADLVHRKGLPGQALSVLYVVGRYGGGDSDPQILVDFLAAAKEHHLDPEMWAVCAFGRNEGRVAMAAMSLGGHVRVGFENNFYLNDGRLSPDNGALVKQVANGARLLARPVCQGAQARRHMSPGGAKSGQQRVRC